MEKVSINRFPALGYACSEAINTLCTSITFSGENIHRILITSCHSSEGKSFLSMNIMRTLAGFGKTVALVDADMRLSGITSKFKLTFGQDNHSGLSQLLAGMADVEDVIYETNIPGAYIVPVGRLVSNTLPLLNSPRLSELLDRLSSLVDYVIVDTPPLGEIVDAMQISKLCDAAIIVVKYNSVRRNQLIEVKRQLEQANCLILGAVLNEVDMANYMNRKYYYKYKSGSYGYYSKYSRTYNRSDKSGGTRSKSSK